MIDKQYTPLSMWREQSLIRAIINRKNVSKKVYKNDIFNF
jgi:hypothetical protein